MEVYRFTYDTVTIIDRVDELQAPKDSSHALSRHAVPRRSLDRKTYAAHGAYRRHALVRMEGLPKASRH